MCVYNQLWPSDEGLNEIVINTFCDDLFCLMGFQPRQAADGTPQSGQYQEIWLRLSGGVWNTIILSVIDGVQDRPGENTIYLAK